MNPSRDARYGIRSGESALPSRLMTFLAILTGILTASSLFLATLIWGVRRGIQGRWPEGYWRRTLRWHVFLVVLYLFVGVPALLGWLATSSVKTRGDEAKYVGPCLGVDGRWKRQTRDTMLEEVAAGERFIPARMIEGDDGVRLRTFIVPPDASRPTRPITAVIVHGLFRGALEVDPVGGMFHDLGCEVCLVETRNHGRSDRGRPTFGDRESRDLVGVVRRLQARPEAEGRGVVLFGVSLGTAITALAAPDVERLAGLVLDAPMDDLRATADRVLEVRLEMPQPFRWLTRTSIETWAGIWLSDVRPVEALSKLSPDLPALIIGGSHDRRMPPDVVRACYEALRSKAGVRELWIREGSGHGSVWSDAPADYQRRLAALLDRIR